MPNTKISALTAGNPAQGTDEIPIARGAANFKVTAASIAALSPAGTVTSVGGTGTVNGLTLTGTVTSSGNLTLGGTLSGVSLTTQVSGTLPTANGGTNLTSFTSGGAVYATSASALTTGTLPLTAGGTGATTKAAAFNALSPIISTGDLIIGNGPSSQRLAIGSFNQYLRSNGTTASWANVSVSASDIAGTLQPYQGGTGTSTGPTSNGQLLIGNGFGGYNVNTLTAGTGVTITNGSGTITIAASGGGGGATISELTIGTSMGSFYNFTPGGGYPRPLIGYTDSGPSKYGAFFFHNGNSNYYSFLTINSIQIMDTVGGVSSYSSGPDFFGSSLNINGNVAGCYNINLYSTPLQTLFSDSSNAFNANSLKPVNAQSGPFSVNPQISLFMSGGPSYSNGSGGRAVLVLYKGAGGPGSYDIGFASGDVNPASNFSTGYAVSTIGFQINGSLQSYSNGIDYTVSFWNNSSSAGFNMSITATNPSLITLLDNSSLGA